ncbi:hypothetical protein EBZ39_03975 [bacterium]|nr:hypothetical protein [bacterium]
MYTLETGSSFKDAIETLTGKKVIPLLVKYIRSVPRERFGGAKTEILKNIRSDEFILDESHMDYLERALSLGIVVLKSSSYDISRLEYTHFIIVYGDRGRWYPVSVGESRAFVQPAELYTAFDKSDMFMGHISKVCKGGVCKRLTLNNTIESVERSLGLQVQVSDRPLLIKLITVYVSSTLFQRT